MKKKIIALTLGILTASSMIVSAAQLEPNLSVTEGVITSGHLIKQGGGAQGATTFIPSAQYASRRAYVYVQAKAANGAGLAAKDATGNISKNVAQIAVAHSAATNYWSTHRAEKSTSSYSLALRV